VEKTEQDIVVVIVGIAQASAAFAAKQAKDVKSVASDIQGALTAAAVISKFPGIPPQFQIAIIIGGSVSSSALAFEMHPNISSGTI
jgi:hypothetical protein